MGGKPLTLDQIRRLRARAGLRSPTSTETRTDGGFPHGEDEHTSDVETPTEENIDDDGTEPESGRGEIKRRRLAKRSLLKRRRSETESEPEIEVTARKKPRRLLSVSLTDVPSGEEDVRTNTVNSGLRQPFTVLLWNVENYGENKSLGNPFANRVIRLVMDELNVDLAIFLETQSVPTDVVTALEHNLANRMRTSREKKQGPGTDITTKTRFTREERRAMEREERVRRTALELLALDEDEEDLYEEIADDIVGEVEALVEGLRGDGPRFHAITSIATGKQGALPPRIGPYRRWTRGTTSKDKQRDASRFKKVFSYDGSQSRPTPHWLLSHLDALADVYDLRFRVAPDYDEGELTRPLTRDEIAKLRRCVQAMCYTAEELAYWRLVARRHNEIDEKMLDRELLGSPLDGDRVREMLRTDLRLDEREELVPEGREGRQEVADLLRKIETSAVLTLKPAAELVGQKTKQRELPPREFIGWINEGNSCYLNAVLQLLRLLPAEVFTGEGGPADPAIVAAVATLLRAYDDEASRGRYDTRSSGHPPVQEQMERNFVRYQRTRALRSALAERCGWPSIYGSEDAGEALIRILQSFGPPGSPTSAAIRARNLDAIRPTPLHFFSLIHSRLDWDQRQEAVEDADDVDERDDGYFHVRGDVTNVLTLPIPKADSKTFRTALAEYRRRPDAPAEPVRVAYQGQSFVVPVTSVEVELEPVLPQHLLVRIERMVYRPGQDGVGHVREKVTTPLEMPREAHENGRRWELHGFVKHHGESAEDGHYTTYVRSGDRWYHIDDGEVTPDPDIEHAVNDAFLYYYGPPLERESQPNPESMDTSSSDDLDIEESSSSPMDPASDDDEGSEEEPDPIEDECALLAEVFEHEPDDGLVPPGALPAPREVDEGVLLEVQALLSEMIGVRNVETYVALFRRRPDPSTSNGWTEPSNDGEETVSSVHRPIWSARHPNVGHYVFKRELLSRDAMGRELGYQDPLVWLNGRCPFYFELDVWPRDGGTRSVRLPFVAFHAPYGLPPALRTVQPKRRGKPLSIEDDENLPDKSELMDFDGPDKASALEMRADAMQSLLELGIPSYQQGVDPTALRDFGDAIIAGDFNLNMAKRSEEAAIDRGYRALEGAQFFPVVDQVRTTLHPVESMLPARDDEAPSSEDAWYGSAYDNIFVRSSNLPAATTSDGTVVGGAVDVFDFIARHGDELFDEAEVVVGTPANYHPARYSPQTRARHELARWERNDDDRARAYFLYRRYVSDHLPVFVDLDIQSDVEVRAPVRQESSTKVVRPVLGITNYGNTCYLNASLQMFFAFGNTARWSVEGCADPDLRRQVASLLEALGAQGRSATYEGDGQAFGGAGSARCSFVRGGALAIQGRLHQASRYRAFARGRQEDAVEAVDAILTGCGRRHSDGARGGGALDLSPPSLAAAALLGPEGLGALRPTPVHFFLEKRHHYYIQEGSDDVDGLPIDDDGWATEIECHGVLRLDVVEGAGTLQATWDANRDRAVVLPETELTRVKASDRTCYLARRDQEQTELIGPAPDYLIVQIKRFVVEQVGGSGRFRRRKDSTPVDASGGLTLGDHRYEVIAVVRHVGHDPEGGHYVAYVHVEDEWYEIDDQTVTYEPPKRERAMMDGYLYLLRRRPN